MLNLILLGLEAIAFSVEEMPNKTEVLRIRNDCTLDTLNGISIATRCSFHHMFGVTESFLVQIRQIYVFFGGT